MCKVCGEKGDWEHVLERCIRGLGGKDGEGNKGKSKEVIGRRWDRRGGVEGVRSGEEGKSRLEVREEDREVEKY